MKKEQIIELMELLGYKLYNEGNKQYFLPDRRKIKFTTKIYIDKLEKQLNTIVDSKPNKVTKGIKKIKKVTE